MFFFIFGYHADDELISDGISTKKHDLIQSLICGACSVITWSRCFTCLPRNGSFLLQLVVIGNSEMKSCRKSRDASN